MQELEQQQATEADIALMTEVFYKIPSAIIVIDERGIIRKVNQAALSLLNEEVLENRRWVEVVSTVFRPRHDDGHEISTRDGRRLKVTSLSLAKGQLIQMTDLTETRLLQDKLSHMERLSSLGRMAASLAHQIRTPLSAAMLYAANLGNANLQAMARKRFQEKLVSRLEALEAQVSDILMFARSNEQTVSEMDATQLIEQTANNVSAVLERGNASLQTISDGEELPILGNAPALVGALSNLIANAVEAGADKVILDIAKEHNRVVFSVANNGPVIPDELKAKIFEPFFTSKSSGTGLGLAVVSAVTKVHQGILSLDSWDDDFATVFSISVPLYNKEKTKEDVAQTENEQASHSSIIESKDILVGQDSVERKDNQDILENKDKSHKTTLTSTTVTDSTHIASIASTVNRASTANIASDVNIATTSNISNTTDVANVATVDTDSSSEVSLKEVKEVKEDSSAYIALGEQAKNIQNFSKDNAGNNEHQNALADKQGQIAQQEHYEHILCSQEVVEEQDLNTVEVAKNSFFNEDDLGFASTMEYGSNFTNVDTSYHQEQRSNFSKEQSSNNYVMDSAITGHAVLGFQEQVKEHIYVNSPSNQSFLEADGTTEQNNRVLSSHHHIRQEANLNSGDNLGFKQVEIDIPRSPQLIDVALVNKPESISTEEFNQRLEQARQVMMRTPDERKIQADKAQSEYLHNNYLNDDGAIYKEQNLQDSFEAYKSSEDFEVQQLEGQDSSQDYMQMHNNNKAHTNTQAHTNITTEKDSKSHKKQVNSNKSKKEHKDSVGEANAVLAAAMRMQRK